MSTELGPIQLIAFGTKTPRFGGSIANELKRLSERDLVRVLDALVVRKDADGQVNVLSEYGMSEMRPDAPGEIIADLIGLRASETQLDPEAAARLDRLIASRGHAFNADEEWDVIDHIPNDSVAALILLDHRWAIPLRDAIAAEGGTALGDLWVDPRDLAAVDVIAVDA